ncbi:MAG: hypothetical protein N3B16_12625 [Candidatus Aminicenantes bacterium]|nr:hypothetical protein [Candidatus Aminicenantes bacterium]
MRNFWKERTWLILIFLLASASVYYLHYLIFRDAHHIFIYMIGDLGFLFLDVMLVVIVIEHLLNQREKNNRLNKLNMLISAFFSEVGHGLIRQFVFVIKNKEILQNLVFFDSRWQKNDFIQASKKIKAASIIVSINPTDLGDLRDYLLPKRDFLLSLLANPSLLEHEAFTNLLWSIFHLLEELALRPEEMVDLPPSDLDHLNNDVKRVVVLLLETWINYVAHLKERYPFLFSLVVRINPFGASPSPIITQ